MLPTSARQRTPRRFWLGIGAAALAACLVAAGLLVWISPAWLSGSRVQPMPDRLALLDPAHSILLLLGAKSLGLANH